MLHRGPGFDPERLAVVRLRPSLVGFTNNRAWAYQRDVIARLEALPGVVAASLAVAPPHWPPRPTQAIRPIGDAGDPARPYLTSTTYVGAGYFRALGVNVEPVPRLTLRLPLARRA